jgi:hypothetical protein
MLQDVYGKKSVGVKRKNNSWSRLPCGAKINNALPQVNYGLSKNLFDHLTEFLDHGNIFQTMVGIPDARKLVQILWQL